MSAHFQDRVMGDEAAVLSGDGVATIVLDAELRIRLFSAAASHLFGLGPRDIGRPIGRMATLLAPIDLSHDAGLVLQGQSHLQREFVSQDGRRHLVSIQSCPGLDGHDVQGVSLTFVDVSGLDRARRDQLTLEDAHASMVAGMRRLHTLAERIEIADGLAEKQREVLEAAIDITGAHMAAVYARDGEGGLTVVDQVGFAGPAPDVTPLIDRLRPATPVTLSARPRCVFTDVDASDASYVFVRASSLGPDIRAAQLTPLTDRANNMVGVLATYYRSPHQFAEAELHWIDLFAVTAENFINRWSTERTLSESRRELQRRLTDQTNWLGLMHEVTDALNEARNWNESLDLALKRICVTGGWQAAYVYLSDPEDPDTVTAAMSCCHDDVLLPFHRESEGRPMRKDCLVARVYSTGRSQWLSGQELLADALGDRGSLARSVGLQSCVVIPVASGHEVIAVLELCSLDERPTSDEGASIMNDLGAQIARVLERERAIMEMADLAWREQQSLLHTLHDSLGQTLTGVGMMTAALTQQLSESNPAAAASARSVAQQAQLALEHVRQLARGLFPIQIDADGLLPALRDLAATTEAIHKVPVQLGTHAQRPLRDGRVATQLYRIAQEAVTNAVKHARPQSIRIDIRVGTRQTLLRIADDGIGIPPDRLDHGGLGIRIMRHRANSIGGQLSISGNVGVGTAVTCTIRETVARAEHRDPRLKVPDA